MHPPIRGRRAARAGALAAACLGLVWAGIASAVTNGLSGVSSVRYHATFTTATAVPSPAQPGRLRLSLPGGHRLTQPGAPDLPTMPLSFVIPAGYAVRAVQAEVRSWAAFDGEPEVTPGDASVAADTALVRVSGSGYARGWAIVGTIVRPWRVDASAHRVWLARDVDLTLDLEPHGGPLPLPLAREDAASADAARAALARWIANPADLRDAWRGVHPDRAPAARAVPAFRPSLDSSAVSYVIVAPDSLVAAWQPFADWQTARGLQAVVRSLGWIRSTYVDGADDADTIRRFLQDAYATWGTRYVLLGGGAALVPSRLAHTAFLQDEDILTDYYYACLDGTWNADGDAVYGNVTDAVDLLPELHVGRVPAENTSQVQAWIAKTQAFATRAPADLATRVLFTSEVLTPQPWSPGSGIAVQLDGASFSEQAVPSVPSRVSATRLYENTLAFPGSKPETRDSVLAHVQRGYMLWDHVGHGYRNTMSVGDNVLLDGDADALTNGVRQGVIFALNCNSASFDYDCIATHFLVNPNGGAVAYCGATRETYPTEAVDYQNTFYARVYADTTAYTLGSALDASKAPWLPYAWYDSGDRITQYTLTLLGDPAQSLYWRAPRDFAVSVAPVSVGAQAVEVTVRAGGAPVAGAQVTISRAGEGFARALTDAAGLARVAYVPRSTGVLTVGVSHGSDHDTLVTVTPEAAQGAVPMASEGWIVEDGIGGHGSGNGDGIPNPGETVHLLLPLRNRGAATSTLPFATLASLDSAATVLDGLSTYGDIAPGAVQNGDGFLLRVASACEDQHMLALRVTVNDDAQMYWTSGLALGVARPRLAFVARSLSDTLPGDDGDGEGETGEIIDYRITVQNTGRGSTQALTLHLASADATTAVLDSLAHIAAPLAPGATSPGDDALRFRVLAEDEETGTHRFWCWATDTFGQELTRVQLDLFPPNAPSGVTATGTTSTMELRWIRNGELDLAGYIVSRASSPAGPFTPITEVPDTRTSYRVDGGLASLSQYVYTVVAVDSSGNRSAASAPVTGSTSPPQHPGFPLTLGRGTPGSTALRYAAHGGARYSILAGADKLYDVYPDGSEVLDGDQDARTLGVFARAGTYFASSPAIDRQGHIVAATYNQLPSPLDSSTVWMYDASGDTVGTPKRRWPKSVPGFMWSTPACGDLDNDKYDEIVAASSDGWIYAWKVDGSDVRDGDPATTVSGRFAFLGGYLYSSPALADLDRDGFLDIVIGGYDGAVHALTRSGGEVVGFPVQLYGWVSGSPAVYTRGDTTWVFAGTQQEHYASIRMVRGGAATLQWVRVLARTGVPAAVSAARGGGLVPSSGNSRQASPALGDLNGDGRPELVVATTYGQLWALSTLDAQQGATASFWNGGQPVSFGSGTDGVTECSPVLADLTGDGKPDVLMGAENGGLYGFSHLGATVAGFPIMLPGAVRGSPTVWDVDGDGKTDIVYAGWDGKLYRWDLASTFNAAAMPWPTFHHDMARTGRADGPALATAAEGEGHAARGRFDLRAWASRDAVEFAVDALVAGEPVVVRVYDVRGAAVASLSATAGGAGTTRLAWDTRDRLERRVAPGLYLAEARAGARRAATRLVVVR